MSLYSLWNVSVFYLFYKKTTFFCYFGWAVWLVGLAFIFLLGLRVFLYDLCILIFGLLFHIRVMMWGFDWLLFGAVEIIFDIWLSAYYSGKNTYRPTDVECDFILLPCNWTLRSETEGSLALTKMFFNIFQHSSNATSANSFPQHQIKWHW